MKPFKYGQDIKYRRVEIRAYTPPCCGVFSRNLAYRRTLKAENYHSYEGFMLAFKGSVRAFEKPGFLVEYDFSEQTGE